MKKFLENLSPIQTSIFLGVITLIFFILGVITDTSVEWINTGAVISTILFLIHIPLLWLVGKLIELFEKTK
jgi:uncharacterized membrane protein